MRIAELQNKYVHLGNGITKSWTLNTGRLFYIDTQDFPRVMHMRWNENNNGYISASLKSQGQILLHRYIMGVSDSNIIVDHIDGNRWDNRKAKLRKTDASQNAINRGIGRNNKTGYKGVFRPYGTICYYARITLNGATYITKIGYSDPKKAAILYQIAAQYLHGDYNRKIPEFQIVYNCTRKELEDIFCEYFILKYDRTVAQ